MIMTVINGHHDEIMELGLFRAYMYHQYSKASRDGTCRIVKSIKNEDL